MKKYIVSYYDFAVDSIGLQVITAESELEALKKTTVIELLNYDCDFMEKDNVEDFLSTLEELEDIKMIVMEWNE